MDVERIFLTGARYMDYPPMAGFYNSLCDVGRVEYYHYRDRGKAIGWDRMNEELLDLVIDFQPTIFFFVKGEMINPNTLARMKAALPDCTIVHQSPDWYPDMNSRKVQMVAALGRESDITLKIWGEGDVWGRQLHRLYREMGCKNTVYWRKGVDPKLYQPIEIEPEVDVVFLGATFPAHPFGEERLHLLNELADAGLSIRIYYRDCMVGDNLHESIEVRPHVESAYPYPAALGRINLGYQGKSPYLCTSFGRMWPAMVSELFFLTSYFGGIETLAGKGIHLDWYKSTEECIELALRYRYDDKARRRIGKAARKKAIEMRSSDKMAVKLLRYVRQIREEDDVESTKGVPFERCIRVDKTKVYIVQGNKCLHIQDYSVLVELWGDPDIEDVGPEALEGLKEVKRLTKLRKTRARKRSNRPQGDTHPQT